MSIEITEKVIQTINGRVMDYFREINKIPRGSGKEQRIADYLVEFAEKHGFKFKRSNVKIDGKETQDVVIIKPATKGYEDLETVILQAHIDMVCQKKKESTHNFDTDPIEIIVKDGKMTAKDTTLGADDGIGVACMLAILESDSVAHPPLEALFTSDEEDGMTGAMAVTNELVKGKRLINIDTETEGTLYYGCAGGVDANFSLPITHERIPSNYAFVQIELSGLLGGHSGVEIHKKRANAHKLMARALLALYKAYPMLLVTFKGGDKRNVITREVSALIAVEASRVDDVITLITEQEGIFIHEYEGIEPSICMEAKSTESDKSCGLSKESLDILLAAILVIPNGIQAMHGKVEGLVETSCNLGIVRQEPNQIYLCSLIRSFYRTKKLFVLEQMRQLAGLIGADFTVSGDYPDWEPNPDSELIARFVDAYVDTFGQKPNVESIHAGLECGYFSEKFPHMDMIACGPTITGAHTTEETLDVSSAEKVTELLLVVLSKMNEVSPTKVMEIGSFNDKNHLSNHICQCIR